MIMFHFRYEEKEQSWTITVIPSVSESVVREYPSYAVLTTAIERLFLGRKKIKKQHEKCKLRETRGRKSRKNEFQAPKIYEKCWICSVSYPHQHKTTSTKSDHHKKYCHVFMTSCAFIFMHWHFLACSFLHDTRITSCLTQSLSLECIYFPVYLRV